MTDLRTETTTDYSAEACVARGAVYLDDKLPGWWVEGIINTDQLNMSHGDYCALGQAGAKIHILSPEGIAHCLAEYRREHEYMDYYTGMLECLGLEDVGREGAGENDGDINAVYLGFQSNYTDATYDQLHDAWVAEITHRREAAHADA